MFYRIKENRIYDFADYKYEKDCLQTDICTMEEYENSKDNYVIKNGKLELIDNLEDVLAQRREANFRKEFFSTSLGWIRRKVTMKDGSKRDFLSDLLLHIKAGIELGQEVEIITYKTPDFYLELSTDYMTTLQERKFANLDFVQECLLQTVKDFA